MTESIIKKDMRLLLFQALGRGSFEGPFLQEMQKDGVGMSLELADRYYNLTSEAYLRQAAYCVLGIINLGLTDLSGNNVDTAVSILQKNDLIKIFQHGWKKIADLVEIKQETVKEPIHKTEKDFSETYAAQPDKEWIGWKEFKNDLEVYSFNAEEKRLIQYLVKKYASIKLLDNYINDPAQEVIEFNIYTKYKQITSTLFFSLIISNKPYAPLTVKDLKTIAEQLRFKHSKKEYSDKIFTCFNIPKEFEASFRVLVDTFFATDYSFVINEVNDLTKLIASLYNSVVILESPDNISAEIYQAEKGSFENDITDSYAAELAVLSLTDTKDASKRLAIINTVTEKAYLMSPDDIIKLITITDDEWRKKIKWTEIREDIILELLESECMYKVLKDIFDQEMEDDLDITFKQLNIQILGKILREVEFAREFLMNVIVLTPEPDFELTEKIGTEIFLVIPEDWYDLWLITGSSESNPLFSTFLQEAKTLGYSKNEAIEMLSERIYNIAINCRDNPEMNDIKAPFFNISLRECLKYNLTLSMYRKIYKLVNDRLLQNK